MLSSHTLLYLHYYPCHLCLTRITFSLTNIRPHPAVVASSTRPLMCIRGHPRSSAFISDRQCRRRPRPQIDVSTRAIAAAWLPRVMASRLGEQPTERGEVPADSGGFLCRRALGGCLAAVTVPVVTRGNRAVTEQDRGSGGERGGAPLVVERRGLGWLEFIAGGKRRIVCLCLA